jgi:hypothetical protein
MMNRLIMLAACAVLATTGIASAGTRYYNNQSNGFAQPDASKVKVVAGVVAGGGTGYGSGFQVSHPETGEYVITINSGIFKECPVINITPAGTNTSPPLANLYGYSCANGTVTLTILMIGSTTGTLENNAFHFTAIQP